MERKDLNGATNLEDFRSVLLQSPGIFLILRGPEFTIDFANQSLLDSWQRSWDIVGKPLLEALPEIKDQPFPMLLQTVYNTGVPHYGRSEKAVIIKNGLPVNTYYNYVYQPIHSGGRVAGIIVMATDVTEEVEALEKIEAAQKEAERQKRLYETITSNTPDLIYVFDLNYRFTYANEALLKMWGSTWEQSIGKTLLENGYEPWHAAMHEREIDQVVATRQPIRGAVSFPHATLGKRLYDYIFVPVVNEKGEVEAVAGTTRDITEIKQAEEALKQSEEQFRKLSQSLEQVVRERTSELQRSNEDLQQFAHVASHDLKEPVRKIRTFSSRLRDEFGMGLPEKAKGYLEKIEKSAERMYVMIEGVLLYAAFDTLEQVMEEVRLADIFKNIENDLEVIIQQKNATISYQELPVIKGSAVLLYQLFYNLVNNSLKFSETGVAPRIRISSAEWKHSNVQVQLPDTSKQYLSIVIEDNGIGFDQTDAARIFQTFARLNPKDHYEGTGLGLALCKKIVERHKGVIYAQGKKGEGAVFTVILPVE
ncbi:MAG TPA: ATP-binding protein [Chitinophagaceae bacterium]|nr:ATP-binding protein [Chitinophagaceae bacterium]